MRKQYRVDGFVSGIHTSKHFYRRKDAERFGEKLNQRGEIVFLMRRMSGSNDYDILKIIQ